MTEICAKKRFSLVDRCVRLVMFVVVLLSVNIARAGELTVAEGDVKNSYAPVYGSNCSGSGFVSFFIYPSTMLEDINGRQINSMTFYATEGYENVSWGNATFDVCLKEDAEKTSFTTDDSPSYSDMTSVLTNGSLSVADGKMTITLATPYIYKGGNLQVCVDLNNEGDYNDCYFYGQEVSGAIYLIDYNSSSFYICDFLPKVTFGYSLATPQSLAVSEKTGSGAKFTWATGVEGTTWNLRYKKTGDETYTEKNGLTTNEYTFTDLAEYTEYTAEVQAVNGEETSGWSSITFRTNVAGLTVAEGDASSNKAPVYGQYCDIDFKSYFIYPSTMLEDINGRQINSMTFYAAEGYENVSWDNATFDVYLKEDAEKTSFSTDDSPSYNNMTSVFERGSLSVADGKMTITLATPYIYKGGNLQVCVSLNSSSDSNFCNFYGQKVSGATYSKYSDYYENYSSVESFLPKVTFGYSLAAPQSLAVSEKTGSGAKLTWATGAEGTTWNLRYKKTGDETYTEENGLTANEYTFTDLAEYTEYTAEVQAVNGEETTAWSSITFRTNVAGLTVAEGDVKNSYAPVYGWYCDMGYYSYFIYPSTMLEDLNGGQINSMTFYASEGYENVSWGAATFDVYLKEDAEKTSFTTDDSPSYYNMTSVLTSGSLSVADGKMTITLATPYIYKGGNLQVCVDQNSVGDSNDCNFYGQEVSGATYCIMHQTGAPSSSSVVNFLPKVTFGYSLAAPQSLAVSEKTGSGAKLTWATGAEGTTWNLRYKKTGDETYTEENGLTANEYIFTDLAEYTEYTAEVQAVNGEETSSWSSISFRTKVAGLTVAEGEKRSYVPVYGGCCDMGFSSYFIYPSTELAGMKDSQINSMTFYAAEGYENVSWGVATFDVYLKEDAEKTSFTTDDAPSYSDMVSVLTGGSLSVADGKMTITLATPYIYKGGNLQVCVNLNSTGDSKSCYFYGQEVSGATYLTYVFIESGGSSVKDFLPKVTFGYTGAPESVTASEVGESSAVIAWTGNTDSYKMQYREVADEGSEENEWVAVEGEITSTSYLLEGLEANTRYEVQVCGVLNETENTAWSASCEFQTTVATGIESVNVTEEKDDVIYDLMGRRVENPSTGIYIKNGKKMVIIAR